MPRLHQLLLIAPLALAACSQALVDDASSLSAESAKAEAGQRFTAFQSALEKGDFVTAEIEAAHIVDLDPARGEEVIAAFDGAREANASGLMARATGALEGGDHAAAEQYAAQVLSEFGETNAADAARSLLASASTEEVPDESGGLQLASAEQSDKRIKDAERYVARGGKRNLKGLVGSGSAATRSFESSASDYAKAIAELDKVAADDDATAEQQLVAQQLREKAVAQGVDVQLNTARFYMNRGSNEQAHAALDQARSLDPANVKTEALSKQVTQLDEEWGQVKKLRKLGGKKWQTRPAAE